MANDNLRLQPVHEVDWDYLIILDACRYDVFEEVYDDYLDGELKKVKSRGSATPAWLSKTFQEEYDYTYISANPFINDMGVEIGDIHHTNYNWKATDHFEKIIDVWYTGWDEEISTVHPKEVNINLFRYKNSGKNILHYIQPHVPYIGFDKVKGSSIGEMKNKIVEGSGNKSQEDRLMYSFRDKIGPLLEKHFGRQNIWKIRKLLSLELCSEYEYVFRTSDLSWYKKNAEIALESISNLIKELSGKIIITADHGEAFGEKGRWGHPADSGLDVLREVPWLEIEG
ncbi:MAG: Arylsulfatase A family enzyme [Candidatus Methanohalarchaeum thermophilum]|uniref:Arylsulfatase A family enzyme n=1 Tax=Methanohalarchaeum thermophilum TaxID=1903181 RepID=A0A1Q6DSS8_METT1|nr:MAG: Arylsulfatase A family enzyme [Candidatus Methanohalarchaeum thermophilum]